ncbi:MAG: DUF3068 domain-containing protein [Nocardiopsaceae bacterium]|nr:DUF3068 domain-containing protein [Nocardiopsaceae bacterium]
MAAPKKDADPQRGMSAFAERVLAKDGEAVGDDPVPRRGASLLRRNSGPLALGLGAFLITFALLLRFYAADQFAVLPANMSMQVRLVDETASHLDTSTWKTVEDSEVTQSTQVHGSPSPGNPDWVTWEVSVDTASGTSMIGHMDRRVVVHRSTKMAVNCCGEHVDGDRAVRQAGLVLWWPAGAYGEEYPFYDADIRAAPSMVFDGHDEIAGVEVRRYVQTIDATQIPGSKRPVPAGVLGLDRSGTVTATRWLELRRTYWIEPVSGRLVNAAEERRETLKADTGTGDRVLLDADFTMPDTLVAAYAEDARAARLLIAAVRTWLPAGLGVLGVLLVPVSALTWPRGREGRPGAEEAQDPDRSSPSWAGGNGA